MLYGGYDFIQWCEINKVGGHWPHQWDPNPCNNAATVGLLCSACAPVSRAANPCMRPTEFLSVCELPLVHKLTGRHSLGDHLLMRFWGKVSPECLVAMELEQQTDFSDYWRRRGVGRKGRIESRRAEANRAEGAKDSKCSFGLFLFYPRHTLWRVNIERNTHSNICCLFSI